MLIIPSCIFSCQAAKQLVHPDTHSSFASLKFILAFIVHSATLFHLVCLFTQSHGFIRETDTVLTHKGPSDKERQDGAQSWNTNAKHSFHRIQRALAALMQGLTLYSVAYHAICNTAFCVFFNLSDYQVLSHCWGVSGGKTSLFARPGFRVEAPRIQMNPRGPPISQSLSIMLREAGHSSPRECLQLVRMQA